MREKGQAPVAKRLRASAIAPASKSVSRGTRGRTCAAPLALQIALLLTNVRAAPQLQGAGCLPFSESPSNPTGIGPTEDDVSLVWLNSSCTTPSAVSMLETQSPISANIAGIGQIFSGPAITQLYNAPGLPPNGDPRTPDILVTPNIGVTYSGSTKKLAEHGGFAHDDVNVIMLLSNPRFNAKTVTTPVETMQVAPTILAALGLDPHSLQAVQKQGTPVLPELDFDNR
jgi:hypothetical protein